MGAEQFNHIAKGESMTQAFNNAREEAFYWEGHGGYTGSIAEKHGFIRVDLPEGTTVDELIELIESSSYIEKASEELITALGQTKALNVVETYNDKWGPAIGIEIKSDEPSESNEFVFIGYASS